MRALGAAAQITHIAEHLGQWDDARTTAARALLHGLNVAATAEVADHIPHEVLGCSDLDRHHRLEQDRIRPASRILERHRTGDLERELGQVDLVVCPVEQRHLHVDQRVTGQHAEVHRLLAAGVDGRMYSFRIRPPVTLFSNSYPPSPSPPVGSMYSLHAGVLPGPAGLLLVGVVDLVDLAADRLAIRHLRLADVGLDPELAAHPVDQDVECETSPIPAMIVWPVSSSVRTWKVGSSSARRWIAVPSFS